MTQRSQSLSERIADGIVQLIEDEQVPVGHALASSRELAKRFDVTTPTIREALRRLESTGVVELKHGSGTYVADGLNRRLVANQHALNRTGSVLELIDARLLLEPQVAAAAATNRTEDDLAALVAATDNALAAPGTIPASGHFHVALAAATGNRLVADMLNALLHVRSAEQKRLREHYDNRDLDRSEHVEITDAIRDRDAEAATRLVTEHLQSIRRAAAEGEQ